jgi:ketosteroid isomerase-like protein
MKPSFLGLTLASIAFLTSAAASASSCAPQSAADPVDSIRKMFTAATQADRAAMIALFDSDFYAYDGGKRYSRDELADLPMALRAAGKTYTWAVTEPDVHVSCDTAWVAYVNRGTITDASGSQPMTWLESADLVWRDGAWKLRFLHSTRAPTS